MQLNEIILKYLDLSKVGFFIEAGANDGLAQSNTSLLEFKYGWRGVLVEPSLSAFEQCKINRPNSKVYNYCLVSNDYTDAFIQGDFDGSLMSSVNGKRLNRDDKKIVRTNTLQNLLDIEGVENVDLLSLDTEGYEYNVLMGIDFNKTFIKNIVIEIYQNNINEIFDLLKQNGYNSPINLTNFNLKDNPRWDGTHNDYLFIKEDK